MNTYGFLKTLKKKIIGRTELIIALLPLILKISVSNPGQYLKDPDPAKKNGSETLVKLSPKRK